MKLDRPTHILKSNRASMWMSEFTEEIPGQIAGGINRLGDGEYASYSIYPLPPDAAYDETVYPDEWIQTTGIAPERLTVEIRRLDTDGMYRVYTIGHSQSADEATETEPIYNGDHKYLVRPAEVLTATEAIDLFQHYYDQHGVPAGWHLREQAEFTIPADGPPARASGAATSSDAAAAGPAPVAGTASDAAAPGSSASDDTGRKGEGRLYL